jgi:hypothetical protein
LVFLMDKLSAGIKWFQALTPEAKKFLVVLAGILAVLGPLTIAFGGMMVAAGAVYSAVVTLAGALAAVSWPVVAIVAGIGALGAVIGLLLVKVYGVDGIVNGFKAAAAAVMGFVTNAIGFFMNFRTNVAAIWDWFKANTFAIVADLGELFGTMMGNMVVNTQVAVNIVNRIFAYMVGYVGGLISHLFEVDMVKVFAGALVAMLGLVAKFAKGFAKAILNAITGKATDLSAIAAELGEGFDSGREIENPLDGISRIIQEGQKNFVNPLEGFQPMLKEGPELALEWGEKTGEALNDATAAAVEKSGQQVVEAQKSVLEAAATASNEEVAQMLADLEEKLFTFNAGEREMGLRDLNKAGASDEELKRAGAMYDQLDALKKQQDAMERAKELTEKYLSPMEKLTQVEKELTGLREQGLISLETFNAALKDAQDAAKKDVTIKFNTTGIEADSADALARLNEFRQLAPTIPGAMMQGANGEQFIANAQNNVPKPVQPSSGIGTERNVSEAMGKRSPGGSHESIIEGLLMQIAENTRETAEREDIVIQEANLAGT